MVTLEDLLTCLKTRDVSRHAMKTYKRITKAQLLAIDNATLFPLKRENVMLLFKLVNEFQEKTSLIVDRRITGFATMITDGGRRK